MSAEDRHGVLQQLAQPLDTLSGLKQQQRLSLLQEALSVVAYTIFPSGCMFLAPVLLGTLGALAFSTSLQAGGIFLLIACIVAYWPIKRWQDPFPADLLFRYASLVYAWEAPLPAGRPYLLIAPPHGVLPVANLLTLLAFPSIWGFGFTGLTVSSALRVPIMRQLMTWIGCASATAKHAHKLLQQGHSLGISPGGVSEIFDVNNKDEVIFMQKRKGFVKLALRTGTPLVPCYCFGNTKLFSCWYDSGGRMRALSRKLGFGLLPLWGRFGLPIVKRYPLTAITGKPIEVPVELEPTQESIDKYHAQFLQALQTLFDTHKAAYGWGDKQLIIN